MSSTEQFVIRDIDFGQGNSQIVKDSAVVRYDFDTKMLKVFYIFYTGNDKYFLGLKFRGKESFDKQFNSGEFDIKVLVQGDEETKQIKNIGGGALIGAALAGPLGAAAGAYVASNFKQSPCVITIFNKNIKIKCLASASYLKNKSKEDFFNE